MAMPHQSAHPIGLESDGFTRERIPTPQSGIFENALTDAVNTLGDVAVKTSVSRRRFLSGAWKVGLGLAGGVIAGPKVASFFFEPTKASPESLPQVPEIDKSVVEDFNQQTGIKRFQAQALYRLLYGKNDWDTSLDTKLYETALQGWNSPLDTFSNLVNITGKIRGKEGRKISFLDLLQAYCLTLKRVFPEDRNQYGTFTDLREQALDDLDIVLLNTARFALGGQTPTNPQFIKRSTKDILRKMDTNVNFVVDDMNAMFPVEQGDVIPPATIKKYETPQKRLVATAIKLMETVYLFPPELPLKVPTP